MNLRSVIQHKRRLIVEYKKLHKDPITEIYSLSSQDGNQLILTINGPKNTIYEDKKYDLQFEMTVNYPFEPPKVKCLTPIVHPNIYQGKICLDILQSNWTPIYSIPAIAVIIQHLLAEPDISNDLMPLTKEHAEHKRRSMRHVRVWQGRRDFMMFLAGIGILNGDHERYPVITKENEGTLRVLSYQDYLQNIMAYL